MKNFGRTIGVGGVLWALGIIFTPLATKGSLQSCEGPISHRAVYTLSLVPTKDYHRYANVKGTLTHQLTQTCDGWIVNQKLRAHFITSDGLSEKVRTNNTSWEAKDGSRFRFNHKTIVDNEKPRILRGEAVSSPLNDTGKITYELPHQVTYPLPAETLFPVNYLKKILKIVKDSPQNVLVPATTFDGAHMEDGPSEVMAAIGKAQAVEAPKDLKPFASHITVRPMRLGIFKMPTSPLQAASYTGDQPRMQIDQKISESGINMEMTIDYGDFKLKAVLTRVDILPNSGC